MTIPPRVYVETTIPSFYHEARESPDVVARRDWTRRWWEHANERYELVTSPAVLGELIAGPLERQAAWLGLLRAGAGNPAGIARGRQWNRDTVTR
jgi:hypothetical protein